MDGPLQPSPAASSAVHFHENGVADYDNTITRHGGNDELSPETKTSRAIAGMEGGAGEFSYTRNSRMQAQAINILKPILEQEIGELNFDDWQGGSTVRMADFGCSVGANTLQYAELCFRNVQECSRVRSSEGREPPVVQYFFCDLPSNDFNTLFRQLEEWRDSRMGAPEDGERKKFFAAAVPGSFYGPLFPPRSLHVAISVLALQWMSQVPDAVVDRASPAYNRGRVWIDRNKNTAVLEGYAEAARQDLRNFLLARAEEVVSGGLVLFYATGRRADESHPELQWVEEAEYAGPFSVVFESTWEELVVEGIIDEERRDSFNVPFYCHSVDEVRAVAESTNAYDIKRLETKRQSFFAPNDVEQILAAPEQYGQFMRNFTRALMNSYMVEHIGEKSTTEFFDRLERNAAAAARERRMSSLPLDCVLAILIRK